MTRGTPARQHFEGKKINAIGVIVGVGVGHEMAEIVEKDTIQAVRCG
jgi:hypothetical protein